MERAARQTARAARRPAARRWRGRRVGFDHRTQQRDRARSMRPQVGRRQLAGSSACPTPSATVVRDRRLEPGASSSDDVPGLAGQGDRKARPRVSAPPPSLHSLRGTVRRLNRATKDSPGITPSLWCPSWGFVESTLGPPGTQVTDGHSKGESPVACPHQASNAAVDPRAARFASGGRDSGSIGKTPEEPRPMAKYVFVTGGVTSSLGKGITAASIGRLLKSRGLSVSILKLDPYINVDPARCRPTSTARSSSPTTAPRRTSTWATTSASSTRT